MSLFGSGRREGLLAVLALLLVTVVAHAPGLFSERSRAAIAPTDLQSRGARTNGEIGINQTVVLPALQSAGQIAAEGQLPLWNRSARLGEPFSVTGAPLLYPPFWLLMLPDGPNWLDFVLAVHGFLACLLFYRFLRSIGLSRYVGFIGGAGWGLGWFLTAQGDRLPELAAMAWMPFSLETTWRVLVTRDRARWGGWMAIALALPFLTGGCSTAVLTLFCCVVMVAAHFHVLERSERGHAARTLAIATLLGAAIAAPMIVDWLQHLPHVAPSDHPATQLRPAGLLAAVSPEMGTALSTQGPASLQHIAPGADPLELVLYPGATVMFLLVLGLFRPKHKATEVFWTVLGGLGLLLTVAGPTADAIVPALGRIIAPGGALLLTQLAAAVLAAIALENFLDNPLRRAWAAPLTAYIAAVALCVALVGALVAPQWAAAMLGWLAGDNPHAATDLTGAVHDLRWSVLLTAGAVTTIGIAFLIWRRLGVLRFKALLAVLVMTELLATAWIHTPRHSAAPVPITAAIDPQPGEGRTVLTTTSDRPGSWRNVEGERVLNTPGNAILGRTARLLEEVDPLWVQRSHRTAIHPLTFAALADHPLLHRAAVDNAIGHGPLFTEHFVGVPAAPPGIGRSPTAPRTTATPRLQPVSRARVVFDVAFAQTSQDALQLLRDQGRRLDRGVVENSPHEVSTPTDGASVAVEWLEDSPNRIRMRCNAGDGSGYLILADAWSPGWEATLDGNPVALHRGDFAFRAVALPEGSHTITFEYRPWVLRFGWIVMGIGLTLAFGWRLGRARGFFQPPSYA